MVRHAESIANKDGIIQGGGLDVDITKLGERQAKKCGEFINSNFKIKNIWCSPMIRTRKTTETICKDIKIDKKNIKYFDDLIEIKYGIMTGKTVKEVYAIPKIGNKFKTLVEKKT